MKSELRKIEIVVLSDVHLGTYGCRANELSQYLKSINPQKLILNGDIIDIWQFSKRYWPISHMKVVKQILNLASKNTQVYYVTGNHDEAFRKFSGLQVGNLSIVNQLELKVGDKKAWVMHGDIFDAFMKNTRWLTKLGAIGYDTLIILNVMINYIRKLLGYKKLSLSKRIKDNVKTAVKFINNFEDTVAGIAINKKYDLVICGHIHQPEDKILYGNNGKQIRYLNSGDWVENLTALEYNNQEWSMYKYKEDLFSTSLLNEAEDIDLSLLDLSNKVIFQNIFSEFQA